MNTSSYSSLEKLKSKKLIDILFSSGKSVSKFPLKLIYAPISFEDDVKIKAGVSVSKRNFKKAVDRNRIKRLLREAYRLNKHIIYNSFDKKYVCMFLYLGKDKPTHKELYYKMDCLLHKLIEKENQENI